MSAIYAHRQPLGHVSEPVAGPSTVKPSNVGVAANRRDSVASIASSCYSYGSSSSSGSSTAGYDSDDTIEEDDEIATPPFLPADAAEGFSNNKGKGRANEDHAYLDLSGTFATFSLSEDNLVASVPLSPPSPTRPLPPAEAVAPSPAPASTPTANPHVVFQSAPSKPPPTGSETVAVAPNPPDSEPSSAHVRPLPQPSPPTRAVEEAHRGRSRWPRLLWRSELDMDSLVVLKNYHERAVGQPLPVLRAGMVPKQVETWSRRMEYAGL